MLIAEKQDQIDNLDELCDQFDIKAFREQMLCQMESSIKNVNKEEISRSQTILDESESFLLKQIQDHSKNSTGKKEDVFIMSLKIYKSHLRDLINKDIQQLKNKKERLLEMLEDLTADAAEEKAICESALEERDNRQYNTHDKNNGLREMCQTLRAEIDDISEEYTRYQLMSQGLGAALDESQLSDTVSEEPRLLQRRLGMDKALLRSAQMAETIFKGNDKLHKAHMNTVISKFTKSKAIQTEKTERVGYRAQLAQNLRDR